jgi:hypothetical protein
MTEAGGESPEPELLIFPKMLAENQNSCYASLNPRDRGDRLIGSLAALRRPGKILIWIRHNPLKSPESDE